MNDALWRILDEWQAPQPSTWFDETVMARIRSEASPATNEQVRPPWWRAAGLLFAGGRSWAVCAALATVLLAAVLLRMPGEVQPGAEQAMGPELSAQQVETALEDLRMLEELYGIPSPEDAQSNQL